MNFRKDLKLPAQAYELVICRVPRIRRWRGDLAGLAGAAPAPGAAALAHRAAGPAWVRACAPQ
jgi:hypothetical protein